MAIDWGGVKRDFEEGDAPVDELAEKYGCSESTVKRRAMKEGWAKAAAYKGADIPDKPPLALRDTDVLDDNSLWQGVRRRLVKGLHNNDAKLGLEELKVAKLAGEVLSSVIKGERMALGAADDEDGTDDIATEMARLTLPQGAGEADDGE